MVSFFIATSIFAQTADFTFQSSNGSFCSPSTITFNQTCTGNPVSFIWDFGNGNSGSNSTENNVYATGGTYTVKLTAIFENTVVEIAKTILINPSVNVSITADRNYICQPGIVNLTATSTENIVSYEWSYGDSRTIEILKTNTTSHFFQNYGSEKLSLRATATTGCIGDAAASISIQKLIMSAVLSKFSGCIPASVNFRALVTAPKNSVVSSYSWDYGDGSPTFTSVSNTAINNYTSVGQYFPKLTVTTNEGCTNTINVKTLAFGTPPANHVVSTVKNNWCGSETVILKTTALNANRYLWTFGDGSSASTTDTIMKHKYTSTGKKNITVRAFYNECPAAPINISIDIIGVVAQYNYVNSCIKRNEFSFSDVSSGQETGRLWTYGDSTLAIDSTSNTIHSFPNSGKFITELLVTDSMTGCRDSISKILYTATPDLFNADTAICKNSITSFSILNNTTNPAAKYTWNVVGFVNAQTNAPSLTINANKLGNFQNFVAINYGAGSCIDTIRLNRNIVVKGPNLDFTMPTSLCINTALEIKNNSQPFVTAEAIITSYWNYGNSSLKDSIYQPMPIKYNYARAYSVKLVAIDVNGCQDSLINNVTVHPLPILYTIPARDTICYNTSVNLISFHNEDLVWSPGSTLSCTTCDSAVAKPLVSTEYICTSTNIFGCSTQDTSYITVSVPFTTTINTSNIFLCLQDTTQVYVEPKGKIITWSPATGLSKANSYNPFISPSQNTVYTISLSDSAGCLTNSSSATLAINIKSLPTVNAGPNKVYAKGQAYSFTPVYSSNVQTYLWTPSVLLNCADCAFPNGINTNTQQYVVKVTSDSGCVAKDSVLISIECKYANILLPSAFTPNNDNLNDYFYPITSGIKMISKFIIYNRAGKVVFEAGNFNPNNKNAGWNGTYKGANLSAENYVYTLEAICDLGEILYKRGSVMIIR